MEWVKFTTASQAVKGAKMRPESTSNRPGRKKSYIVSHREQRPAMGNYIVFTDGNHVKLTDAKSWWLVESK